MLLGDIFDKLDVFEELPPAAFFLATTTTTAITTTATATPIPRTIPREVSIRQKYLQTRNH
jgi:hypothetical protein